MANETEELPADSPPAAKGGAKGILQFVAALVLVTLIAAGGGGAFGLQVYGRVESAVESKADAEAPATQPRYTGETNLRRLPPILTNLAAPADTWIRLEASIVFDGESVADAELLASQISEDILAFLRTVSLPQIQGASGLQHLREDLGERAAIRSERAVRELVIETLVVQ